MNKKRCRNKGEATNRENKFKYSSGVRKNALAHYILHPCWRSDTQISKATSSRATANGANPINAHEREHANQVIQPTPVRKKRNKNEPQWTRYNVVVIIRRSGTGRATWIRNVHIFLAKSATWWNKSRFGMKWARIKRSNCSRSLSVALICVYYFSN